MHGREGIWLRRKQVSSSNQELYDPRRRYVIGILIQKTLLAVTERYVIGTLIQKGGKSIYGEKFADENFKLRVS
jgi:hypothetical protein